MISEETREDFMQSIYDMFSDDSTNDRANQIIDIFDISTENCIELPCEINEICAVRRKNYIGREVHERAILKGVAFVVHNSMGNLYIFPENVMTIESMIKLEAVKVLEEREQE